MGPGPMAPRIDVKEIEVQLADGLLTIRGEKRQDREEKEKGWYLTERAYGSFMRQIPLPVEVEEDKGGPARGAAEIGEGRGQDPQHRGQARRLTAA